MDLEIEALYTDLLALHCILHLRLIGQRLEIVGLDLVCRLDVAHIDTLSGNPGFR